MTVHTPAEGLAREGRTSEIVMASTRLALGHELTGIYSID